jgi:pimeloyl-ACP methyl ester carboxylesterase
MAQSEIKKSTIVRLIGLVLAAGERIAPGLAARWVSRQWFTLPPPLRVNALPVGGEPFEVSWQHGTVRGQTWGQGPVVYLVHGWGGASHQFAALVDPLRQAGYTVVAFDAPSHGSSDPGEWGPTSTTGVEFGKALDAVFMKFGRGEAVIAHSMGGLSTLLAMSHGWFGTNRLVFVAPMAGYAEAMDVFQSMLGFGPRIRRRVDMRTWRRVGLNDDEFDVRNLWSRLDERPAALIVQDDTDPQAPYAESRALAEDIGAEFMTTTGLGHNRVLADRQVARRIVEFLQDDESEETLPAA